MGKVGSTINSGPRTKFVGWGQGGRGYLTTIIISFYYIVGKREVNMWRYIAASPG